MNTTQSLKDLLDVAVQKHQTFIRQLSCMAQERGFAVEAATLGRIRNNTDDSRPTDETVRAIGWLAGVPESVAFTAAHRRVPGPPLAQELPEGVDSLPPRTRQVVIGVLRVLVAAQQHRDRSKGTTPRKRGGDRLVAAGPARPGGGRPPDAPPPDAFWEDADAQEDALSTTSPLTDYRGT
ncbi:hypothetical protein GCM10009696_00710 [Kocuria himachalensis]